MSKATRASDSEETSRRRGGRRGGDTLAPGWSVRHINTPCARVPRQSQHPLPVTPRLFPEPGCSAGMLGMRSSEQIIFGKGCIDRMQVEKRQSCFASRLGDRGWRGGGFSAQLPPLVLLQTQLIEGGRNTIIESERGLD